MAGDTGNGNDVKISLHARHHRPENIIRVEPIDIFVDENNVLHLRVDAEGKQRCLPNPAVIEGRGLLALDDPEEFASAGWMAIDTLN